MDVEIDAQLGSAYAELRAGLEATLARASGNGTEETAELRAALQRFEDGTYGRCIDCTQQIPVERLEIVPTASRCVSCQQRRE